MKTKLTVLLLSAFLVNFLILPLYAQTVTVQQKADESTEYFVQKADGTWQKVVKFLKNENFIIKEENNPAPAADNGTVLAQDELFAPYEAIDVGSWPEAVAIGDLNSDGKNDVAMVTSFYFDPENDNHLFVFLQDQDGKLMSPQKYPTLGTPRSVDVGDVNGDGHDDVIVGNYGKDIRVFLQNASGALDEPISLATKNSYKVRIGDFNNDGLNDVVGIGWSSQVADVFLQSINGQLIFSQSYPIKYAGFNDLEVGDVNNDGLTDIVAMGNQINFGVLTQNTSGTFNNAVYYSVANNVAPRAGAIGDVNGDSFKDVFVCYGGNRPSSKIASFIQNPAGTLNPAISADSYDCPESTEITDLNFDGRDDSVVLHGGWMKAGVYLQNDGGTLESEKLYPIPYASHYNPHGLALGDINGDHMPDIVLADYNYGLVILRNNLRAPIPDIKINDSDEDVTLLPGNPLKITIALDAGDFSGQSKDVWLKAESKSTTCWFNFTNNAWIISENPMLFWQGSLQSFGPTEIANAFVMLPPGIYTVTFAVDSNNDGKYNGTVADTIRVQVMNR